MALAQTLAVALLGVEGRVVQVEADLAAGVPGFSLVGLPDASLNEARDRVRAAVVNSGHAWPARRITVNLSPATLPKRGSGFDLAIAVATLAAAGTLRRAAVLDLVLVGELGLDGRLHAVRGVLPAVLAAVTAGHPRVVVPSACAAEARLVPGAEVLDVASLRQLLALLRGEPVPDEPPARQPPAGGGATGGSTPGVLPGGGTPSHRLDLADVLGQPAGRHALELAAAGGHNLFLHGPPGAGKTMLAERLPGLLPDLDEQAALAVTAVHSVAGTLPEGAPLMTRPPFQAPHSSATMAAVVGGGTGIPRPGALSLAHRGVLFLDEAPEFATSVLDALRGPLESGEVVVIRSGGQARYPARFALVLACNPCPCGRADTPEGSCECSPAARRRYLGRLSGPLLDRVDLRVRLLPVTRAELVADRPHTEPSAAVADRVLAARARTAARMAGTPWRTNADVPGPVLRRRFPVPAQALQPAERMLERGQVSARGVDRLLRVAWTLADLAGRDQPGSDDVRTAIALRSGVVGIAA